MGSAGLEGVPAAATADRTTAELPGGRLRPYVPRVVLGQLAAGEGALAQTVEGTVVFVDVSGFTKLSERLARRGREGAEHLADAIGGCFSSLLALAYANGGSLLKFGGDALLLLFDGADHVERGVRSAAGMRRTLREVGRIEAGGARVNLRMSVGVHTGAFHFFLVGDSHREFLVTGPAASCVVGMEGAADAGEIVLSPEVCRRLQPGCVGAPKGPGRLLVRPPGGVALPPDVPASAVDDEVVARCLSTGLRSHVMAGAQPPEHRTVTVAFVHFDGTDELIERRGLGEATDALDRLVCTVQAAADEYGVCFLASDVDADGGKLILTAGAPRVQEDDEERMLLALRRIAEADLPLPVHIGVNRGPVFAGDVGPHFRRTYTVMGDAVNLAARLMAKAPKGEIYASGSVLDRSATRFELSELEPFLVKGKAKPVQAWSVGPEAGARPAEPGEQLMPLVGRAAERKLLEEALEAARTGSGRLIELIGEPGIGKTRLLEELQAQSASMRRIRIVCEPYSASTAYAAARTLLAQLLGAGVEADRVAVFERVRATAAAEDPELLPWMPLLAVVLDVPVPLTPEVEQLAPETRQQVLARTVLRFLEPQLKLPTLVAIEDVQHIDAASADLLRALAERVGSAPWLLAFTRRDGNAAFVAPAVPELVRIEPPPLDPEETLELAEALTQSAPIAPGMLHVAVKQSGGNPQFLRDLVEAATQGVEDLPEDIEAAAMARIDRLSPGDRELVRRASVLGVEFDVGFLEHVLDEHLEVPDQSTWDRLAEFFERDDQERIRFRRPIVREAAYEGLPFKTRRKLHALASERLEREAGAAADDAAEVLSLHFRFAGDFERAYRYARVAGDRAADRFAYADALALYRRALEAADRLRRPGPETAELWESLATARLRNGQPRAAAEALVTARRLVKGDPLREAQILYRQALVEIDESRVMSAVRCTYKALRKLDELGDDPEAVRCRAQLVAALARIRARQGRLDEAARVSREAIALAEAVGDEAALARACYVLDWALVESGQAKRAHYALRALELYRRLGDRFQEAVVLHALGTSAYREGRWDDAVSLWQQGSDAQSAAGSFVDFAFGIANIAELLSDQGRLEEAETRIARCRQIFRGAGYTGGLAYTTGLMGRLAQRAGRPDEGCAYLEEAVLLFSGLGAEQDANWARALLAEAHATAGRPSEARAIVERLLDGGSVGRLAPLLQRIRGVALAQSGEFEAAHEALGVSVEAAREQGEQFEIALSLDALDGFEALLGRSDPYRRAERDAIAAQLDIVRFPPCRLEPGTALSGAGEPVPPVLTSE